MGKFQKYKQFKIQNNFVRKLFVIVVTKVQRFVNYLFPSKFERKLFSIVIIGFLGFINYLFLVYTVADFSVMPKEEQKLIDEFYTREPSLIVKGKLFDVKYNCLVSEDDIGIVKENDWIEIVTKTDANLPDFSISVYAVDAVMNQEKSLVNLAFDGTTYYRFMDSFGLDFSITKLSNRHFLMNLTMASIGSENRGYLGSDLRVEFRYRGGSSSYDLKLDNKAQLHLLEQYKNDYLALDIGTIPSEPLWYDSNTTCIEKYYRIYAESYYGKLFYYDFDRWADEMNNLIDLYKKDSKLQSKVDRLSTDVMFGVSFYKYFTEDLDVLFVGYDKLSESQKNTLLKIVEAAKDSGLVKEKDLIYPFIQKNV